MALLGEWPRRAVAQVFSGAPAPRCAAPPTPQGHEAEARLLEDDILGACRVTHLV